MARVAMTGAEWQSVTAGVELNTVSGALQIDTTTKYGGSASYEVSGAIGAGAAIEGALPAVSLATLYAKLHIYIDSMTSSPAEDIVCYWSFVTSGGVNIFSVQFYNDSGTLHMTGYINDFATNVLNTTTDVAFDQWMRIEVHFDTSPADGSEVFTIRLNGSDVYSSSALTFTNKTVGLINFGGFNGSGGSDSGTVAYFDDIIVNNTSGSFNNTWVGDEKIVVAVPTGAGDNAATTGIYSYINEIPPSNTATSGSTMIELDTTTAIGDYNMTDSSTLGIDSYDSIKAISVMARVREEAAGASNYTLRIKSASGGTVSASSSVDGGNATVRTNPSGTTAFGRMHISESDPTTGVAWTPTGTNSVDNMQVGAATTDGNPDIWVLTLAAMIGYVDGSPPPAGNQPYRMMMGIGF